MVSNNAQLKQISVALRENRLYKERTSWNQSNAVYKEAKVGNTECFEFIFIRCVLTRAESFTVNGCYICNSCIS